jgi:hypothetical protein
MSDQIELRDIQTGVEMGWHKKTNVVPEITRENCGIVYTMEKHVMAPYTSRPLPGYVKYTDDKGNVLYFNTEPKDFNAIVSLDDGMPIGGAVGKGYKMYDNGRMFEMVQESIKGTRHKIVSIGTICNRSKCFASIRLDGASTFKAGGRETENVLNILWGHGGAFSIQARSGMTVVVCANTFAMAMGQGRDFTFKLKHTGNADAKLANMAQAIDAHYGVVSEFRAAMDSFADTTCTKGQAERILAGFLVRDTDETEVSTRTQNQLETLNTLFARGKGNRGENMCDLFNAVTDYYTHESSGGDDVWRQVESSEFGMGQTRKGEMYSLLRGSDVPKLGNLDTVSKRGDKVLKLIA